MVNVWVDLRWAFIPQPQRSGEQLSLASSTEDLRFRVVSAHHRFEKGCALRYFNGVLRKITIIL
jgi:hypothetical protein